MTDPRREDFSHITRLPVRWGDADALGHVNNAKFLTYDESARVAYFDPYKEIDPKFCDEHGLILAHIGCDFLSQLRYPADLEVGLRIARIGRSSLNTVSGLFTGERLVAKLRGVLVWFDYRNQKTMPVPDGVRAWIRGREKLAPEE